MTRSVPVERLGGMASRGAGLDAAEVEVRRRRWGTNAIVEAPSRSWIAVARDTARDPMIWFLVGTAVAYACLGEITEAVILAAAIAPLVGMDAYLHRRTRASMAGLSSTLAARARVARGAAIVDVPAADIVPGDLVVVEPGEPFPADGIVVDADNAQVDESALTGESYPTRKRPVGTLPVETADLAIDDVHWGMAGTRLLSGRARLRIAFTGRDTLYGQIVQQVVEGTKAQTPLQTAVQGLVTVLLVVALALCVVLAIVRFSQGYGLLDALVSAATLAVAALPEEFPVALTVFLGVGVYRLARRQALVRRAVSVETIGRITAICSDKTGTITEGRLRVGHVIPVAGTAEAKVLALAALASRRETHDPLDEAILDAAGGQSDRSEVLATYPFTEDRRRETIVVRTADGPLAVTKGAPEVVLALTLLPEPDRAAWAARVAELAASAHKVIACAWRPVDGWPGGEPDREYRLAGLVALEDPVRDGVAESVRRCREAGIHVVMVTGDHPLTADAIAREIGLGDGSPRLVTGEELDAAIERGDVSLRAVDVVARARPMQKLALVRALQAGGEHVAVTGDGVNDVPALQAADVGIAMGRRGTQSAREVASIVLLDDDFRSIVRAVAEGRQLFRNLQLSFMYLLTIHIPLVVSATLIPLAGLPLLYLPIHIVWLETLIHPTALLVFQELPASERLEPVRRGRQARFFSASEWAVIAAIGLLVAMLLLWLHHRSLGPRSADIAHARAMAVATMSLTSAVLAAFLSGLRTRTARVVATATVATALLLIQVPAVAPLLHVSPLHADDWALAIAGTTIAVAVPLLVGRAFVAASWAARATKPDRAHPSLGRRRGRAKDTP